MEPDKKPSGQSARKTTLRDVAKQMDLSVTTISKVVNDHNDISDETKKAVRETIRQMGYTPNFMASNLRRKHGNIVGLVLSDIAQPFFSEVIYGYEQTLNAAGYQTLIFTSFENSENELRLFSQISSLNIAGLIVDIAQSPLKSIEYLRSMDIPFVLSNRYVDKDSDYFVVADNVEVGFQAVRHILSRKPASPVLCINGPDNVSPTADRFEGYKKALSEAGIPFRPDCVFNNHFGLRDAYLTGRNICARFNPPFSVFCSTDYIAVGFMRAVAEAGFAIPESVSIIGVDDIAVSEYLTPSLTTMSLPKELMGRKSAAKLISLIENGRTDNPREFVEPVLTVRETT